MSTVMYRCPKCGNLALVNTSSLIAFYPPTYSYYCAYCDETGQFSCTDAGLSTDRDLYFLDESAHIANLFS